ncbi:hypothetical protein M595_3818 [Lyngbya aestuarii BL J]|uniref:Uncharacterized protein n=1 Tax=Lyngbya aestuarii BL J TaxID=1348334 RepID=U7QG05_9CYAN|nr:hypothetical protein M595_3818 [Lyngbya aestuarii BL J]
MQGLRPLVAPPGGIYNKNRCLYIGVFIGNFNNSYWVFIIKIDGFISAFFYISTAMIRAQALRPYGEPDFLLISR